MGGQWGGRRLRGGTGGERDATERRAAGTRVFALDETGPPARG